jgi:hypothetical protein
LIRISTLAEYSWILFDTVYHQILLKKLVAYGIREIPLNWFSSYLSNRQQYVTLNNQDSPKQAMVCGIPQ